MILGIYRVSCKYVKYQRIYGLFRGDLKVVLDSAGLPYIVGIYPSIGWLISCVNPEIRVSSEPHGQWRGA